MKIIKARYLIYKYQIQTTSLSCNKSGIADVNDAEVNKSPADLFLYGWFDGAGLVD